MNKMPAAIVAALALAMPLSGTAAPDEAQKQLIQRAQEAKKKLNAAQHMAQMQQAKPRGHEHMKLMQAMMSQMMGEHQMMMQGMGKK